MARNRRPVLEWCEGRRCCSAEEVEVPVLAGPGGPGPCNVEPYRDVISTDAIETRLRERGLRPRWTAPPPEGFSDVVTDSREASPGVLFCALRGTAFDGHGFVARAAAAGAVAALVDEEQADLSIPQLVVTDSRAATAMLASIKFGDPAEGLALIGITGTNGKTTTAIIARHLLGAKGEAGAIGTLGWFDTAGHRHPGRLTTPDPFDLMDTLRALRADGARFVAMEVSSHALDQRRVAGLCFAAAAFTNLTREHLDYHPDMASYRAAKLRLAAQVAQDAICAVNADDPEWGDADFAGRRVVTYGMSEADYRATDIRYTPSGSTWTLVTAEGRWSVRLPLLGEFNVHNALAALSVAHSLGVSAETAAERLASTPQVPGRMEVLSRDGALVLRDYMHTPDAYDRVLGTLRTLTAGRLFIVFGCGGDRDRGKRPLMGRIAAELADQAFITTDNPRSEDPADICRDVVRDMPTGTYRIILDREEAIGEALSTAGPGDVVLLAGKGHETYQDIAGERIPFDEETIVAARVTGRPAR